MEPNSRRPARTTGRKESETSALALDRNRGDFCSATCLNYSLASRPLPRDTGRLGGGWWRSWVEGWGGGVGWRSCSCRSCPREETGAAGPNCVSNALRCAAAPWEGRRSGGDGKGEEAESRLVHILTRHVIQLQHTGISSPGKKKQKPAARAEVSHPDGPIMILCNRRQCWRLLIGATGDTRPGSSVRSVTVRSVLPHAGRAGKRGRRLRLLHCDYYCYSFFFYV